MFVVDLIHQDKERVFAAVEAVVESTRDRPLGEWLGLRDDAVVYTGERVGIEPLPRAR